MAPPGSYDKAAFERGKTLFNGQAKCATCHVPPLFTEPGNNLHAPSEILSPTLRCLVNLFGEGAYGDRDLDASGVEEASCQIVGGVPVEAR